ncbi:hypothetical protein [Acanthopleuribacter pedis]|uniref:Transmembrane protein n=1 Tax=Acanthopleuribacter pedis TaxID=442870 RepID=A0A8J7QPJ6_9BACT|nr:hypothetical protein [Acanthopleuribacter pedis]MBO1321745.1 hypothetical protein [Acanthopleuribacter pedis]
MSNEAKQLTTSAASAVGRWSTRELELVISGAVIVALLQLPAILSGWAAEIAPHLSRSWFMVPYMFYYCGLVVLYPVILCFSLHFILRGFWVGLLGLNAVFPNGIRWDHWKGAAIEKALYQTRGDSVQNLTKKVDAACSLMFSMMFSLIFVLIAQYTACAVITLIFILIAYQITPHFNPLWLMLAAFIIVMSIGFGTRILAAMLSRPLADDPDWADRHPKRYQFALKLCEVGYLFSLAFVASPIQWTQSTNVPRRWVVVANLVLMYTAILCAVGSILIGSGMVTMTSDIWTPAHGLETSAYPEHYENRRLPGVLSQEPSIQSDMISDDYLRLTIPLSLKRDNERMAAFCPDLKPMRQEGFRFGSAANNGDLEERAALLACFSQWITVERNGQVLNPEFLFSRDPVSGLPCLLAYIPCDDLPTGRHLLTITKKPLEGDEDRVRDDRPPTRYIPFWKNAH